MAALPQSCEEHQPKYKQNAWELYTTDELGMWVHLLMKRAEHRTDLEKKRKDLVDARNYLNMMLAKLNDGIETLIEQESGGQFIDGKYYAESQEKPEMID